jgi:uncharacterized protein YndB with AHSA1/START domain
MMKLLAVALLVSVAALAAMVLSRPDTFHIERSTRIAAPAEVVFSSVNDFHRWAAWSPWDKLDPKMKKTFGGSPEGAGAFCTWAGNDQVGEGRMSIIESLPPQKIVIRLDFTKPWQASNTTSFQFVSEGPQATRAVWAMDGRNNFGGKVLSLFMNVDRAVGQDFETGLAALKAESEKQAIGHH